MEKNYDSEEFKICVIKCIKEALFMINDMYIYMI